jgi:hypothetical protein
MVEGFLVMGLDDFLMAGLGFCLGFWGIYWKGFEKIGKMFWGFLVW